MYSYVFVMYLWILGVYSVSRIAILWNFVSCSNELLYLREEWGRENP